MRTCGRPIHVAYYISTVARRSRGTLNLSKISVAICPWTAGKTSCSQTPNRLPSKGPLNVGNYKRGKGQSTIIGVGIFFVVAAAVIAVAVAYSYLP